MRISIFGMEALFMIDNRYRFGVNLLGSQLDIISARATYVFVLCCVAVVAPVPVVWYAVALCCAVVPWWQACPQFFSCFVLSVHVHVSPTHVLVISPLVSFIAGGSKKIDVSFIVDTLQTVGDNLKSAMYASQVESDAWLELLYVAPGKANYRAYANTTEYVKGRCLPATGIAWCLYIAASSPLSTLIAIPHPSHFQAVSYL